MDSHVEDDSRLDQVSALSATAGDTWTRRFGVPIVGNIRWGTHLCQFYESKEDLVDILVPYFVEGIRSNEYCMWVTSHPLEVEDAKDALSRVLPDLDAYVEKGQIDIISYDDWYLLDGVFDSDRVLKGWVEKEEAALKRGFDGLRLSGNTFWVERKDWKGFANYEEAINSVIGYHKMIALCTYSLQRCTGSDVIDVVRNHVGTLIRRGDVWNLVEDVTQRRLKEEALEASEQRWVATLSSIGDAVIATDMGGRITFMNKVAQELTGWSISDASGKELGEVFRIVNESTRQNVESPVSLIIEKGTAVGLANHTILIRKDGSEIPIDDSCESIKNLDGVSEGVVLVFRDISERKKLEKERDSVAKFPDENPDGVYRVNREGIVSYANNAANALPEPVGFINGQLVSDSWRHGITDALQSGKIMELVEEAEGRFYRVSFIPIPSEGYCNIYCHDVTERRLAERMLFESREDLSKAQTVAHIGSWRLDVRNNVLKWSDEAYRIFGIPLGTPLNYEIFLSAVHRDDREYVDAMWKVAFRGGPYDIEHRIVVGDQIKWIHEVAEMEFDKDGTLLGGFGTAQDISELKKTENDLKAAHDEWERTFNSVPDLIAVLDKDQKILRTNKAMAERLNCPPEQYIGLSCYECIHGADAPSESCPHVQTILDGKEHVAEVHEDRLGGDFMVSTTPLRDDAGQLVGTVHVARDITETKKMERKLKESERLATIGQTAAMVGHDLRNPLQVIVGYVSLSKAQLDMMHCSIEEKSPFIESLVEINNQIHYMNKIVADLQDYARPLKPFIQETLLTHLVNQVLPLARITSNVEVVNSIPSDLVIGIDPELMVRVFTNLFRNAVEAMPDGGKLFLDAKVDENETLIHVRDTGVGVAPEDMGKLFSPLFTTKPKGQGLGLPVCKRIVEVHNGSICAKSEPGKGATFTIRLPRTGSGQQQ